MAKRIAVLGTGSWGTALARVLAKNGHEVIAWSAIPKEAEQLDKYVRLSGMTKQDYLADRVLEREVVVQSNPRVYKALQNELNAICAAL